MSNTPSAIKLHRKTQTLELQFDSGQFLLSAEFLRVHSPSAEVKGHGPGQEVLQLNKHDVQITGIETQGNYAIKIVFNDGHDSGLYSWNYLLDLGENQDEYWASYCNQVKVHEQQDEQKQTSPLRWTP